MALATTRLRWSSLDPLLTGLLELRPEGGERLFEVPSAAPAALCFGRILSGDAWPAEVPALDRVAPVPMHTDRMLALAAAEGRPSGVVLHFEASPGERIPVCVAGADGSWRWAFDPAAWMRALLAEDYVGHWARPLPSRIPLVNYARLPHALKGWAETLLGTVTRPREPRWRFPTLPLDTLVDHVRTLCSHLAGVAPARRPDLWPNGCQAAVTLTHDVDTAWILEDRRASLLQQIVETESSLGFRGAWYVVASRLSPRRHARALRTLREAGHEIGAHGWNHDAKLGFVGRAAQERRMLRIEARLRNLGVEGIRTPWYFRSPELFDVLERHFSYDSSVPSASDLFGTATHTGCCTVFPYRAYGGILELPMTLPPDTAIGGRDFETVWGPVSEQILDRGGVIVPILHPQPHQSAEKGRLTQYFDFLRRLADRGRGRLWCATPSEIVRRYESAVARQTS